ncbi:UNVERIFIED_CONTAM: hypothetical protein Sradi_3628000 [Sesamum radiatum]|uniref:Zinc knuckle CX2CX4HX4C domain-containing protein n=1 Tax=Sesamum radiatum TaxID=300843 RepID=A0AAW2QHK0_SESRA
MGGVQFDASKLRQALQLGEGVVDELVVPDGLWRLDSTDYHLCLVGRLLSRKESGIEGCPTSFEKNILVSSFISNDENPMNVDLSCCDFFIHVHDLPLSKMNLGVATSIGNKIGRFKDMEMDSAGMAWGATLRIRAAINMIMLLLRALKIKTTMGEEHLVTFMYERLPNFCYLCERLGHINKHCLKRFKEGFLDPGTNTPYGPWLRAPNPNRYQSKSGIHISTSKQSNSGPSKGSRCKGPTIFGVFRGSAHEGGYGRNQGASIDSERVGESNSHMVRKSHSLPQLGGTDSKRALPILGSGKGAIEVDKDSLSYPATVEPEAALNLVQERVTSNVQNQLVLSEENLVNIPLVLIAKGGGRRGSARRGKRGHKMVSTASRKKERGITIIEPKAEVGYTTKKHMQLLDEESDLVLAETALQSCRELWKSLLGTVRVWGPLGQFDPS